jgi:hypothetical protein
MQIDIRVNDEIVGRIESDDQLQVDAFKQGFSAGVEQPEGTNLGQSETFDRPELSEWYGTGASVGQSLAKSGHLVTT